MNSLSAPAGSTNPALGPIASFAADAQALSAALNAGSQSDASHAMAALLGDRQAVDSALSAHPESVNASDWNSLRQQLDKLAERVKPAAGGETATAHSAAASAPAPSAAEPSDGPKLKIESYVVKGHLVRIKGFFEGRALKSAGIYQGDTLVRDLKVDHISGLQHVSFDIELAQVEPGMVLRVYDGAGLSAEASIASRLGIYGTGGAKEVEVEPGSEGPVSLGGEVASGESDSGGHNVAEIPAQETSSPSRRHIKGHATDHLGDIQVSILNVTMEDAVTRTYDVIGQITGNEVRRAGVYVDGNLAREIDIDDAGDFTSQAFDETFQMNGRTATIRVYGPHDQYIEHSIRLAASAPPPIVIASNPNGLAVQILSLRQVAPNLMVVSGVLSGKNLSSAGLYQNGMLVQALPVSASLLGSVLPDTVQQVNFSAQFNPAMGPASVRLIDATGQIAEQPVMVAGINPYATNPYGAPMNPYGGNPYGYPNSYPPGYRPGYGYPPQPPASKPPWWLRLLR